MKKWRTVHFAQNRCIDSRELIRAALGTVPIFSQPLRHRPRFPLTFDKIRAPRRRVQGKRAALYQRELNHRLEDVQDDVPEAAVEDVNTGTQTG